MFSTSLDKGRIRGVLGNNSSTIRKLVATQETIDLGNIPEEWNSQVAIEGLEAFVLSITECETISGNRYL